MKLSKRQLKRIIREEKRRLQESSDIYPRPQHPMIAQGIENNHISALERAVQLCLAKGLDVDEICALVEECCGM